MNYLVYKITNQTNGKIYIGVHRTSNVDDGYMGSGVMIKRAIAKYGLENFKKEILAQFESADEMFNEEKNLISQLSPEYNLHPGGNGGWNYVNENSHVNKRLGRKLRQESIDKRTKTRKSLGIKPSSEHLQTISQIVRKKYPNGTFYGKSHSFETKQKISEGNTGKNLGKNNGNFGKHWITNGVSSICVQKHLDIPAGWKKGRVMNA